MLRDIEIILLNQRAIIPTYGTPYSAGLDLYACLDEPVIIPSGSPSVLIPTGIQINMMTVTEECVGCIFPRSGLGHKEGVVLGNLTGVIDQDYHGEIMVSLWNRNNPTFCKDRIIQHGDRIAQLVIFPIIRSQPKIVSVFSSSTDRGAGGFGSTGR